MSMARYKIISGGGATDITHIGEIFVVRGEDSFGVHWAQSYASYDEAQSAVRRKSAISHGTLQMMLFGWNVDGVGEKPFLEFVGQEPAFVVRLPNAWEQLVHDEPWVVQSLF